MADTDTYDGQTSPGITDNNETIGSGSGNDVTSGWDHGRKASMRASQIYQPKDPAEHRALLEKFLDSSGFASEYKDKIRKMDIKTQSQMMSEWYVIIT